MAVSCVIILAVCWEALYQLLHAILSWLGERIPIGEGGDRHKLLELGPSYGVSLLHAALVGGLGCWHVASLWGAPLSAKLHIPPEDEPWHSAASAVELSNVLLFSYLCYDIVHVIYNFPRLGGYDMVLHHVGFLSTAAICSKYRSGPFSFSLLLLPELSSIPLNARWFLLTCGQRGLTLKLINLSFVLLFFATRLLVYSYSLAHLVEHRDALLAPHPKSEGGTLHPALLHLVLAILSAGLVLNFYWFRKILSRVVHGGRPKHLDAVPPPSTRPPSAADVHHPTEDGALRSRRLPRQDGTASAKKMGGEGDE